MTTPGTKEEALQKMRRLWLAIALTIPLYVYIGETMPGFSWLTFSNAGRTFIILSIFDLWSLLWFWGKRFSPALKAVRSQPENTRMVSRWMTCWIILVCLAETEALFGVALQMGSKSLKQSLPLYLVAFFLMLCLWPRQFWSSTGLTAQ